MQAPSIPTGARAGSILPRGNWTLVAADEFNGTSLNTNMWQTIPDGTIRNGNDYIVNSIALHLGSGLLTISGIDARELPGNSNNFSGGGELQTLTRFGNGYYEARVKASPSGWSGFWIIGGNVDCGGGPSLGFEADIIESIAESAQNNVHWGGYGDCHQQSPTPVATATDNFHIWGVLYHWRNGLTFYRDGVQTKQLLGPIGTTPMYIKLTNTLVDNASDPARSQFVCDWVRYYQHDTSAKCGNEVKSLRLKP
jgi:beta-glucanase (GH16 family)